LLCKELIGFRSISAVDNIEQALWGYYSDYRRFPYIASNEAIPPVVLLRDYLADYVDAGQFDGGSDGTFYYFSGAAGQEFVVCGTLGGFDDEMEQGIYCNGNGISSGQVEKFPGAVATDNIFRTGSGDANIEQIWSNIRGAASNSSRWYSESRGWIAPI
jgi:hypothetical protein